MPFGEFTHAEHRLRGERFHVARAGAGPLIVFLHGLYLESWRQPGAMRSMLAWDRREGLGPATDSGLPARGNYVPLEIRYEAIESGEAAGVVGGVLVCVPFLEVRGRLPGPSSAR